MAISLLTDFEKEWCSCGHEHSFSTDTVVGPGVIKTIADKVHQLGGHHVFLICDVNTYAVAGNKVYSLLNDANIVVTKFVFQDAFPEPDEAKFGQVMMYLPSECDVVIGVGSGVINDIGKLVAATANKSYIIVATAPSMDGYASPSSSMVREGLKVSVPSTCPDVILGDVDILCQAPAPMLQAGLGDMLAKYVGVCEWRIAHLVVGEAYCERVAELVRIALKRCVDNADGLLNRDPVAVQAVFEGLVISGAAMQYAGTTRPASGGEHYLSHVWDMRGLSFGTPLSLHGLQCAVGTLETVKLYEKLLASEPNYEKAVAYVQEFRYDEWAETLRQFIGRGAENMIALEAKEGKYDQKRHKKRLEILLAHWDEITTIVREELPTSAELEKFYSALQLPKTLSDIGLDNRILPLSFQATRDIRDKYVLSRIYWDLGMTLEKPVRSTRFKISPSVVCGDPFGLESFIRDCENNSIALLHIDVMDGDFVPNYALGTDFIKALKAKTKIPLDIHLMITDPEKKLDWFAFGENDYVAIHCESTPHLHKAIAAIKDRGAKAMVTINPATPISVLEYVLDDIDAVLVMCVNPGFAGQKLVESTIRKIKDVRRYFDERGYKHIEIEVDGNVSFENAKRMRDAGANIFVAGTSSVFNNEFSFAEGVRRLREAIGDL